MKNLLSMKTVFARAVAIIIFSLIILGCGRVPHLEEADFPSSRLPFVKVLLNDGAIKHSISPFDGEEMSIDCFKGEEHTVFFSRNFVIVQGESGQLGLYAGSGNNLDYNIDRIIISPRAKERRLMLDGKPYRGIFEMVSISGQVRVVNITYVEDYLKGVVPLEIGGSDEKQIEALKAQAVAARTYTIYHLGQYGVEPGYDLKADVGDQVYGGINAENELINRAIETTRGIVAVYRGQLIRAYYFSTCGGTTDDVEDVWDKDPAPYLRVVNDSGACRISKYYTWQERFTADQIVLRLEQYLSQEQGSEIKVGKLRDIKITGRTPGGRIASITFETDVGRFYFKKEKVRWVLKQSDNPGSILRSANFTCDIVRDDYGDISEVILNGRGYGHGVGMCQMGAIGMSLKGITYDNILAAYYPGTELKRLY